MEDKNIETNTMTPRKILIPIKDQQPESPRPTMKLNTYNDEITTPTRSDTMTNKTNDEMKNKFDALMGNFTKKFISTTANNSELPVIKAPAVEQSSAPVPEQQDTRPTGRQTQGTRFFKFPTTDLPIGGESHLLHWKNPAMFDIIPVKGSESQYVQFAGWHLNGAKIWIGTSATNATEAVGINPATGVTGLIPQAVQELAQLTESARRLSPNQLDAEQRPFQFGIVCVLGGQDHAAILRETRLVNMTKQYGAAFRAAGVPNANLRAALYNDSGKLIAF